MASASINKIDTLVCEPPKKYGNADAILHGKLIANVTVDSINHIITVPDAFQFHPGVKNMPWIALVFIRLNELYMLRASCVHDYLYHTRGDGKLTRSQCDAIGNAILSYDGLGKLNCKIVALVLKLFGAKAWQN